MSNGDYRAVAGRIKQELAALESVAARAGGAWAKATLSPDDYYVDAAALNLHGFYAGLERVFLIVAFAMWCAMSMPTSSTRGAWVSWSRASRQRSNDCAPN